MENKDRRPKKQLGQPKGGSNFMIADRLQHGTPLVVEFLLDIANRQILFLELALILRL